MLGHPLTAHRSMRKYQIRRIGRAKAAVKAVKRRRKLVEEQSLEGSVNNALPEQKQVPTQDNNTSVPYLPKDNKDYKV